MHPEAIAPGFVTTDDGRFAHEADARLRCDQFVRGRQRIARGDRANPRWRRAATNRETQLEGAIAEVEREQ
jgi:hypothetical protein